jgi:protein phosphatase
MRAVALSFPRLTAAEIIMDPSDELDDTAERRELDDTAERPPGKGGPAGPSLPLESPSILQYGAASHQGMVRARNEDHYAVVRRNRSRDILVTNVPLEGVEMPTDEAYALIVADGAGGEGFGDLASQLAVKSVWDWANGVSSWIMKLDEVDLEELQQRVVGLAKSIQNSFRSHFRENPQQRGMATTWTCAYIVNWDAVVAHVGDSRAYLCRDGQAHQITDDHTLAEELLRSGASPDDTSRFRSVLTRAFGGASEEVVPDVHLVQFEKGDAILICSDGLTNVVEDDEIGHLVDAHPAPQAACDALIELALERGGPDNVTAVIARLSASD